MVPNTVGSLCFIEWAPSKFLKEIGPRPRPIKYNNLMFPYLGLECDCKYFGVAIFDKNGLRQNFYTSPPLAEKNPTSVLN